MKPFPIRSLASAAVILALTAAACGSGSSSATPGGAATGSLPASSAGSSASAAASPRPSGLAEPVKLTVGLGYIPNVQFAQFYRADQAGYYRDAGLEVTFQNGRDPDLIRLAAQGEVDIAIADGTSLIPAVSQGIPVRYLATIYARFPNVVFAKASSGIKTAADLKGRRIGTPGKYGSGWIMLQVLLKSAGLTPDDTTIRLYPDYGQLVGVREGQVDAATGFVNNEPVQLARAGIPPVVLTIDDIVPLQGNGLIAGTNTIETKRDALALFISATLRAMTEISADPQLGLDAAIKAVPEIAADRDGQLAVLQATIDLWHDAVTDAEGLGAVDRDGWARSIEALAGLPGGLVPKPVTVDQIVDDSLLPVR
ncbi:MAG: putative riboflavin transport system substrate-binding protein [Chloroflexota bacterium]|nr:putative riboflavin transport system substrate-binding protein [Chloroflexota bacterium]